MGLNKNQKKVKEFGKGALLVEAGPGSGKTKVIVERIKYLVDEGVDPDSFLVITFTIKAAENLQRKLKKALDKEDVEKMQISTIHSFCLDFLKTKNQFLNIIDDDSKERKILFVQKHKDDLGFKGVHIAKDHQIPSIVEKYAEYTNFAVDKEGLIEYVEAEKTYSPEYVKFIDENEYFSTKKIKEAGFYDTDWYNARFQQVARSYKTYLKLLDDDSLVDFNTLQLKTLEELQSNPDTKYKTILIDEFQDTDPLQYEIFRILLKQADYFTAVGDIDQRIYSFRSTFKDYFDQMEKEFETTRISLDCNYRSTQNIVNLTDSFIKYQRSENSQKDLKSNNDKYDNPSFIIETDMPKNRNQKRFAYESEGKKIFDIIKKLDENNQIKHFSDIAVLYRKHSSKTIKTLINCLKEEGIPFSIKGGHDLQDQKEVKAIIIMLWYITRSLNKSYISSQDEYNWLNLKGFYDEELEGIFWKLTDSTKEYIRNLQETFEAEVQYLRNKLSPPKRKNTVKNFSGTPSEEEKVLIEIYQRVNKPVIDLDEIEDENDREFFEKLEFLRRKVRSDQPPEILKVYYSLLAMSDYFDDFKSNIDEVSNLATLTQTMANYEEYISKTDIRGLYFFLTRALNNYSADYGDENGVQLMTVHAAKGLEFPVTIVASIEKDEFPMKNKDPKREKNTVRFKNTFYTPNELLKYKYFTDDEGNYRPITIEEENQKALDEEERVIYVAMTRAADLLIVSCLGELPEKINEIRDRFEPFSFDRLKDVKICKDFSDDDEEEKLVLNYSKYTKYCSCPFKYNLGYNLGFSRPGAKAANRGTAFHQIMEAVNHKLIEGDEVTSEYLDSITTKSYDSLLDIEENPDEFEKFKEKVQKYHEKYTLNREILESELDFEIDRGDYILNGAIDLVYKTGENELTILDYKYSESGDEKLDGYTKQLHLYAAALKQLPEYKDYAIKEAITHFVIDDYPHKVAINDEIINKELENLDKVACKINVLKEFPKDSDECENCSYRIFCKKYESIDELNEYLEQRGTYE